MVLPSWVSFASNCWFRIQREVRREHGHNHRLPRLPRHLPRRGRCCRPAGDEIEVRGGTYPGELVITKPVTLIGVDNPVIDGGGAGTLIRVTGADLTIQGFTLRATGSNHDKEDAAIVVEQGRATIVDNRIEDALFGIYLKQAPGSIVRGNVVLAKKLAVAMRGDGIKVWYCDDVVIENNQASDGRDAILWYSEPRRRPQQRLRARPLRAPPDVQRRRPDRGQLPQRQLDRALHHVRPQRAHRRQFPLQQPRPERRRDRIEGRR